MYTTASLKWKGQTITITRRDDDSIHIHPTPGQSPPPYPPSRPRRLLFLLLLFLLSFSTCPSTLLHSVFIPHFYQVTAKVPTGVGPLEAWSPMTL